MTSGDDGIEQRQETYLYMTISVLALLSGYLSWSEIDKPAAFGGGTIAGSLRFLVSFLAFVTFAYSLPEPFRSDGWHDPDASVALAVLFYIVAAAVGVGEELLKKNPAQQNDLVNAINTIHRKPKVPEDSRDQLKDSLTELEEEMMLLDILLPPRNPRMRLEYFTGQQTNGVAGVVGGGQPAAKPLDVQYIEKLVKEPIKQARAAFLAAYNVNEVKAALNREERNVLEPIVNLITNDFDPIIDQLEPHLGGPWVQDPAVPGTYNWPAGANMTVPEFTTLRQNIRKAKQSVTAARKQIAERW